MVAEFTQAILKNKPDPAGSGLCHFSDPEKLHLGFRFINSSMVMPTSFLPPNTEPYFFLAMCSRLPV